MSQIKSDILLFLEKCDELKNTKFIMATSKIKDILKCIVNSAELYGLFKSVTENFDYPSAKSKYFVTTMDGVIRQSYIVLPDDLGEKLAFIFCLFVEIDKDVINFNQFLQQFYAQDGSFFASFQAFCGDIVKSLYDAIAMIYAEELKKEEEVITNEPLNANSDLSNQISAVYLLIAQQKQFILESSINDEEKEIGYKILNEVYQAFESNNSELLDVLMCGYNYYLLYHNAVNEALEELIQVITERESA